MSNRFIPPSVEELAARGLDADGNPIKQAAPKKAKVVEVVETPAPEAEEAPANQEE